MIDVRQALSAQNGRHNNFDYVRLFAATQVLIFHGIYHLQIETPNWAKLFAPFSGVPIFFVVSGFLITASYERCSSLRLYAEKRARRILPGLWFCVVVTGLVLYGLGYPLLSVSGIIWFFSQLAALIYTPAFLHSFGFGSYNGSLWTIPIELQFYATVPALSWLVKRTEVKAVHLFGLLLFFSLVAIAIGNLMPDTLGNLESRPSVFDKLVKYSFIPHYFQFLLGAVSFYLSLQASWWLKRKSCLWLLGVVVLHFFAPPSSWGIVLSSVVLGLFTLSVAFSTSLPPILKGNDLSYGIYLFHGLVLNLLVEFGGIQREHWLYVLLVVSYIAALISWNFVENRFSRQTLHRPFRRTVAPRF